MKNYFIGIDCGGTNIRIGLVDDDFVIHHEEKHQSTKVGKDLGGLIRSYVLKYKDSYSIEAIGIGFPGIVDLHTRQVLNIPNLRAFEGDYLLSLEKELNIPIFIGNDVNILMLYDAKHFNIEPNKSVMGFYLGTGFGSAIRIKNMMYQGDFGAAGEIGHVPMYLRGIMYNQKQSDLESEVSGFNLKAIHDKHFKDSPFETMFIDQFNHQVIQDYLHLLAFYITTQMTILDISTIILGGGVIMSEQFPKAYLESLILKNLFADKTKENFKVYYADSHVNSGIYGAVIFAKQNLDN
ncbi:allose kinase [Acholeplasma laidlawii]|uniref:allose kinase n=1 Tax=Acholeplasma laidlawii TaxID=2148 RepID=UPI0018C296B5|nr:allose kinase [Acholeplasma laidlawii]MBG0762391.1 allose kinase [Acholeplasma laidlawii]